MTQLQIYVLTAMGLYFALMIALGFMAGRKQDHDGFVIGSRNVGYIPTMGSLATSFRDGLGAVIWVGLGATMGYAGIWLIGGVILGLTFYIFVGPRVREIAAENNYVTIGQMVRSQLGPVTERLSSLLTIIFAILLIAIQLYVSGNIFSEVLGMDASYGVWSVAVVVGFYLFFGGYSTVVKTDTIQFFLVVSLIVLPFFLRPAAEDVTNFSTLSLFSRNDMIAYFLIGVFYVISGSETWQRVFSARDKKVIQVSFPVAGGFLVIMTLSLIFLGMAAKPFLGENIEMNLALFQLFSGGFIHPAILAFIAVVVMAISMSTLDTACYLTTSTITKNFLPKELADNRDLYIRLSQGMTIFILIATSIVALTISDVIKFAFDAVGLLYILAPVYAFTAMDLFKHGQKNDMIVSTIISVCCLIYLYMFINKHFAETLMTMIPVAISCVLCMGAVLYGRLKPSS